jgi:hypothetical protein
MNVMIKLKNLLLISVGILISISTFSQNIEKLSEDKVDRNKIKVAQDFADRYFGASRDGRTYEFQDDAIAAVIQGLTPQVQKQVYQDIQSKYGDYKSLEYVETWTYSAGEIMTIVRFKGIFSKSDDKPEIRIVLDKANKIAGFFYKPWEQELK